jgi:hypothetical protein
VNRLWLDAVLALRGYARITLTEIAKYAGLSQTMPSALGRRPVPRRPLKISTNTWISHRFRI